LNRGHGSLDETDVEDAAALSLRFLGDVNDKHTSGIFGEPGKLPPQIAFKRDGQMVLAWRPSKDDSGLLQLAPRAVEKITHLLTKKGKYQFHCSLRQDANDKNPIVQSIGARKWMKRFSDTSISRFSVKVKIRVQGKHMVLVYKEAIIQLEVDGKDSFDIEFQLPKKELDAILEINFECFTNLTSLWVKSHLKMEVPKLSEEEEKKADAAKQLFLNSIPASVNDDNVGNTLFSGTNPTVAFLMQPITVDSFKGLKGVLEKCPVEKINSLMKSARAIEVDAYETCLEAAKSGDINKGGIEKARKQALQIAWLIRSHCLLVATKILYEEGLDDVNTDILSRYIETLELEHEVAVKTILHGLRPKYAGQYLSSYAREMIVQAERILLYEVKEKEVHLMNSDDYNPTVAVSYTTKSRLKRVLNLFKNSLAVVESISQFQITADDHRKLENVISNVEKRILCIKTLMKKR